MKTETKQKIENIVKAISIINPESGKLIRDLITGIYIDGEIAGILKAREILNSKTCIHESTIAVGDNDHLSEACTNCEAIL